MTQSILADLVRIKLPRNGEHFEVITMYTLLGDSKELERLGLTFEEGLELQAALDQGTMKAKSFEGYALKEKEYRDIREAGWLTLLW